MLNKLKLLLLDALTLPLRANLVRGVSFRTLHERNKFLSEFNNGGDRFYDKNYRYNKDTFARDWAEAKRKFSEHIHKLVSGKAG